MHDQFEFQMSQVVVRHPPPPPTHTLTELASCSSLCGVPLTLVAPFSLPSKSWSRMLDAQNTEIHTIITGTVRYSLLQVHTCGIALFRSVHAIIIDNFS